MQIAAQVTKTAVRHPDAVKVKHFKLKFENDKVKTRKVPDKPALPPAKLDDLYFQHWLFCTGMTKHGNGS